MNLVRSIILLLLIIIGFNMTIKAQDEVNFFDSNEINYWGNEKKEDKQNTPNKIGKLTKAVKEEKGKKFSWKSHLNVEDDDFFKEGQHLPPAPLMEVARRPTDKNITNYLKYFGMKNLIKARMQNAIESYIKRNNSTGKKKLTAESKSYLKHKAKEFKGHVDGREKIQFTMYFRATCPHCKRMFKTLEELGNLGFIVEAIQTDKVPLKERYAIPISDAKKEDMIYLKSMGVKGVPYTLIRVGSEKQYSLKGYRSTSEVMSLLKTQLKVKHI
jgi:glutaredoxin